AATFGLESGRLVALRPTDSPATVSVATCRTTGERPFATHFTWTVTRLRSAGCSSAVPLASPVSLQNVLSWTPEPSLGSSIEHSLTVTVYVMPRCTICQPGDPELSASAFIR